ncbi:MAG: hypothetical protein WKG32_06510 [Gemmatimonadaceae bacterium]
MFIELVDSLRCVRPHELTWLVAVAERTEGRDIVRGTLGCPACQAEYLIVRGVVDFASGASGDGSPGEAAPDPDAAGAAELALHAAAFLDLVSPGGFVVLAGDWARAAPALAATVDGVHVLGLNPTLALESGEGVSVARATGTIPVRPGACRGIALDDDDGEAGYVEAAVAALRPGGRLIAPASCAVPPGIAMLARDERYWVGERERLAAITQLVRRGDSVQGT